MPRDAQTLPQTSWGGWEARSSEPRSVSRNPRCDPTPVGTRLCQGVDRGIPLPCRTGTRDQVKLGPRQHVGMKLGDHGRPPEEAKNLKRQKGKEDIPEREGTFQREGTVWAITDFRSHCLGFDAAGVNMS